MAKFLFLYKGFEQPTPEIGAAWMRWFEDMSDSIVEQGNPLNPGTEVTRDSVDTLEFGHDAITGYSVVEAADKDAAIAMAKTNPMITSVLVYEIGSM